MKWKKVTKITHQYVPWQCFYSLINVTFSCPCEHRDGTWERGGTTAHTTNCVLLHTVPSENILATICSVKLPFSQHFINYQAEPVVSKTYPHSLALRGTVALYECVVSLTLHLLYPLAKCRVPNELEAGWARDLAWKPWRSEKSLDHARNLTSITHSSIQSTDRQPHHLHYHIYPSTVRLILNICVTVVTDCTAATSDIQGVTGGTDQTSGGCSLC
jgi:hypothetical protein